MKRASVNRVIADTTIVPKAMPTPSAPCEFGVKVSVATTLKEGVVVGCRGTLGNPQDSRALGETIEQVGIPVDQKPKITIVDKRCQGVQVEGLQILRAGQRRGVTGTMKP